MAFCRLVFPLVLSALCLVHSATSSTRVPVFLWGDLTKTSLKSSPLTGVTGEEFVDILNLERSEDPFTVVFIEENLSVEDLSLKNSDGVTSFPYLHENVRSSVYLPSVESPVSALNVIVNGEADHVKLTENGLSAEIESKKGKFLLITLKDAKEGEARADLLRRHNDFMEEMVGKLKSNYGKVIAMYTADYPSWTVSESHNRVRRETNETLVEGNEIVLNNLLMFIEKIAFHDGNNTVAVSDVVASGLVLNDTTLQADLTSGDIKLTVYFSAASGYWSFDKIDYHPASGEAEELEPQSEVSAFDGWSYRCGQSVQFASVNASKVYTVDFTNYKIQPFFTASNSTPEFGESLNCVGFFSVPIWSGLFIVAIMLFITFYGIIMMMDIRTMDRFDDPKGKTITINASE